MTPTSARPARKIGTSLPDRDFVFVTNDASDFRHRYAAAGIMLCSSSCSRRSPAICRLSCFARRTGDDRKPIDQVLEEQQAWHNLILRRPSESLVQDHLSFGWVTTIPVEAELAEGIAPPLR